MATVLWLHTTISLQAQGEDVVEGGLLKSGFVIVQGCGD
jgi:hypothetical protein